MSEETMEKLSHEQIAEVLRDAATQLRKTAAEKKELIEKLAAKELRERAEKVAFQMHNKGIRTETEITDLADELEKSAKAGNLETIEKAVDLVGPDMGAKLAQINNDNNNDESGNSPSSSAFERFIVGGVG